MSSFVISKSEYMKAAGLVAGIASEMRDFWIYDYESRRRSTDEDFKKRFSDCYNMNALSVRMQYDDPDTETDSNEYNKEFDEFKKLGKQLVYNGGKVLMNGIRELQSFFSSCRYQTEYEPYMFKMQMYFDSIICELWERAYHHETKSWGTLEIETPTNIYERII